MRRSRSLIGGAVLALGVATVAGCGLGGATGEGGDGATLRINTGTPPSHHITTNVWEPWAKLVEQETDGRVNVEIYSGTTLGSLTTALTDLSNGVYDAGTVVPNYFEDSNLFPLTIAGLAFAYPDIETGNKVLTGYIDQHRDDIGIEGIEMATPSVSDRYALFSTTPIRRVEDLEGLQVKVQGPSGARLFEAWGADPVQMSSSETYQALERGTIDVAPYTLVGDMGTKYHEVAPFVTLLNSTGTMSIPSVSQKFLDGLSDDLRRTFEEVLIPELGELNQQTYTKELVKAEEKLPQLIGEAGAIIELSPEQLRTFRVPAEAQWKAWVAEADDKGYDGQRLVNDWTTLLEKTGADAPY